MYTYIIYRDTYIHETHHAYSEKEIKHIKYTIKLSSRSFSLNVST